MSLSSRTILCTSSKRSSGKRDRDPRLVQDTMPALASSGGIWQPWPHLEESFRHISVLGPAVSVVPLHFQQGTFFSKSRNRLATSAPFRCSCFCSETHPMEGGMVFLQVSAFTDRRRKFVVLHVEIVQVNKYVNICVTMISWTPGNEPLCTYSCP